MRRCNLILSAVMLLTAQLFTAVTPVSARTRLSDKALYSRHVDFLASEPVGGRKPGTPGARKARAYIVSHLRQLGLKPAFQGDYCQQFPITIGIKAETQQLRAVGADKKLTNLQAARDFNALALSASRSFSGQAVFVGYAITNKARKYDNFADVTKNSLKGRVAVAMRYEPHDNTGQSRWTSQPLGWTRSASLAAKSARASWSGASALLIVNPPAHSKAPLLTTRARAYGARALPVLHVTTDAFKRMLTGASLDADKEFSRLHTLAQTNAKGVCEIPGLSVSGKVILKSLRGKTYNIAVKLPGRGVLAGEAIIVGAHWDHVGRLAKTAKSDDKQGYFPGADDNASGAAGILILAKRLAARARRNPSEHRRSIVLACFGAEELGLLGSAYMARNLRQLGLKDSQVIAMVNMDMIGRLRDNKLYAWGVEGKSWKRIVRSSAKDSGLTLTVSGPGLGLSDHGSFHRRKIPVVCMNTGLHDDVHRTSDTSDKIDAAGAIRILNVVDRLLESLATQAEPIQSEPADPKSGKPERQPAKQN
ncbi:MAG: M28 family peptidase [Phycisphaerae bacterium]|jgi:hypothetical protein|nr:M28 family peptidase [Phycisphaerae bacterium]